MNKLRFIKGFLLLGLTVPALFGCGTNESSSSNTSNNTSTYSSSIESSDSSGESLSSSSSRNSESSYESSSDQPSASVSSFVPEESSSSQDSSSEKPIHVHSYNRKNVANRYLKSEADCTHKAVYYYSCECGEKGTETFEYGESLGHDWGNPTYTWSDDNSECTATRVCKKDESHIETETVNSSYGVFMSSEHEEEWIGRYTANFTNPAFESQSSDIELLISPIQYTLSSDGKSYSVTCDCKELSGDIIIPGIHNNLPVTSIGNSAFSTCSFLASVTIPDSVVSIGSYAFNRCKSLTTITVGDNNPNYSSKDGVLYNKDKTTLICCPSGSVGDFIIPDSVINIGYYAFYGCSSLTSVTIPNSVTSIGSRAFYNCSSLTSVTIPDSVTSIDSSAFSHCSSLESVDIPNGIASIKNSTFYGCSSLTSVTIPNSVTSIGSNAFYNCSRIGTIVIPESILSIEYGVFDGCKSLESITVNENNLNYSSVDGVMYNKDKTTLIICPQGKQGEFVIPNGVISIESSAFSNCSSLTSVSIPDSVASIGGSAFYRCSNLTDTYITISSIEDYLNISEKNYLLGNVHLLDTNGNEIDEIIIPNDVTTIPDYAFYNCSSLTSVTIPDSVTSIGGSAFSGCSSLESITLPFVGGSATSNQFLGFIFGASNYFDNASYVPSSLKEVVISNKCNSIVSYAFYNCSSIESVDIPNSVTSIGFDVFSGCSSLQSITIPDSVTSIGSSAFYGCSSLESVDIPNGIASIEYSTFSGCSSLTSITIPNSVTSIGFYAFSGCSSLGSISIPDSVISIDYFAFFNCSSLTSITVDDNNPNYSSIDGVMYNKDKTKLIICPQGKRGEFVIHNGAISIEHTAFSGCSSLTSVTIPNSVTSIGNGTFSGCSSLKSIVISNSVASIEYRAFYKCSSLESVDIPSSVTSIGNEAFFGCTSLTSVTIPNSVTSIGDDAFIYCSSLKSIIISSSVISIGNRAFSNCSSLKSIVIPNNVALIGDYAFSACSSLTSITVGKNNPNYSSEDGVLYDKDKATLILCPQSKQGEFVIPNGVVSIKDSAFEGCSFLKSIIIPNSVTSIGDFAFVTCSSLESIIVSDTLASIGDYAFHSCSSLESIFIPSSVTSIGQDAFTGCFSLTSITVGKDNPNYSSADGVLYNKDKTVLMYFPSGKQGEFVIPDSVITIGNDAFYYCSSLESVDIPSSVTSIGNEAFFGCSSLTSITVDKDNPNYSSEDGVLYDKDKTVLMYFPGGKQGEYMIPDSVITIGNRAFSNCTSLTSVTIPDSATSIGYSAFSHCSSLESIIIPSSVTMIGNDAFYDCSSLTSITVDNNNPNYSSIDGVLYNKDKTTLICFPGGKQGEFVIPDSVITVETSAFGNCSSLGSIIIPSSVTSIGHFYNCLSLKSITFKGTILKWNSVSKANDWNSNIPATVVHCKDGDVAI